jgi:osmotically-inducible protein OsmY
VSNKLRILAFDPAAGGQPMNDRNETIREKLVERLAAVSVDASNLVIEVDMGRVVVSGSVPSKEQRERAIEALAGARDIAIFVRPLAPVGPGTKTDTGKAT